MFSIPVLKNSNASINWKDGSCSPCNSCVRLTLPLFNPKHPDKIMYNDIVQGNIGSCWFLSVLISYIRPNTKNIESRITDIYKSISIYRHDAAEGGGAVEGPRTIYIVKLNNLNIYVDDYILDSYDKEIKGNKLFKCMWYILFEKAMISLMTYNQDKSVKSHFFKNNLYVEDINARYGEMKSATIGIGYLISKSCHCYCLHKQDSEYSLTHIDSKEMYLRFKSGDHIMANTARWTYPGAKFPTREFVNSAGGVATHCYAIIDMIYSKEKNTYLMTIQNPWGNREIAERGTNFVYPEGVESGKGTSIITWERFHHLFACVHMTK